MNHSERGAFFFRSLLIFDSATWIYIGLIKLSFSLWVFGIGSFHLGHRICGYSFIIFWMSMGSAVMTPSFISDIVICIFSIFSWLAWLDVDFIDIFEELVFGSVNFFNCFSAFSYTYLCSNFYYLFSLLASVLHCPSISSFLRWKLR